MKILLTNVVMLNGGDAAIVFGTVLALRAAFGSDVEIKVCVSYPDVVAPLYPELTFLETPGLYAARFPQLRYVGRIARELRQVQLRAACWFLRRGWRVPVVVLPDRSIREALEEYVSADLIVSGGGTYLRDDYGMISNLADYRLTLALGKPLAFFTQSIGPFADPSPMHPLRAIFDRSVCILLRDERSLQYLNDMGVRGPAVAVVPDAAFALGDEAFLQKEAEESRAGSPVRVAISVRDWKHFATCTREEGMSRYLEAIAGLVRHLLSTGIEEIVFLSTCQGIKAYDNDAEIADRIVSKAGVSDDPRVSVLRGFIRFDKLLEMLKSFDFTICTRLHVSILSLLAGTPALPIAYEFKSNEVFGELGLSRYVLDIENISEERLIGTVELFQNDLAMLSEHTFRRLRQLCGTALCSGEHLCAAWLLSDDGDIER
jgi:colanic acid/amylovoran biosynthesis protein